MHTHACRSTPCRLPQRQRHHGGSDATRLPQAATPPRARAPLALARPRARYLSLVTSASSFAIRTCNPPPLIASTSPGQPSLGDNCGGSASSTLTRLESWPVPAWSDARKCEGCGVCARTGREGALTSAPCHPSRPISPRHTPPGSAQTPRATV
jgi:hypothetical protein